MQRATRERRAYGQPELEGAALGVLAASAAQLGRRRGVDLADRLVELTHAAEPGREGDVGRTEVGGLEQHPRGLGALGPRQRERAGAELLGEEPREVTGRVPDVAGEAVDALAVDHAVTDQPHRAAGGVGGDVPVGAARGGVGEAPLAGAEAGRLGGRGGRVERDVVERRGAGGARRPAVDAGGADGGVEDTVEPAVAALHRAVAGLEVLVHRRVVGVMPPSWPMAPTVSGGNRTRPPAAGERVSGVRRRRPSRPPGADRRRAGS